MRNEDRRRRILDVCDRALERDPADRAAFIAVACGDDVALRNDVEDLLAHADEADAYRTPSFGALAAQLLTDAREGRPGTADTSAPTLLNSEPIGDSLFAAGHILASRYRIVAMLGRGGMGEVYRADDLKLGHAIALKLIATRFVTKSQVRQFVEEVRLAREIAHPNVCRVYDIGEAEGWHYLSMEFVDGETLESLFRRIGRLPYAKALDLARQLCAGLAAAHECGVLHRDLKPANVMVDGRGRVRIMDFGLAVSRHDSPTEAFGGTPAYAAPEQVVGGTATEQTDLYALGVVLFELFTGQKLFATARTFEERRALGHALPPIGELLAATHPVIERIIDACLEIDPAKRPPSAGAVGALIPSGKSEEIPLAHGEAGWVDTMATAGRKGALSRAAAWSLLSVILAGTFAVASQAPLFSIAASDVPEAPEALAERARNTLRAAGVAAAAADREFWFAPDPDRPSRVKFVYRQSAQPLVPRNMFRVVSESDPPNDIPGMATVTMDARGRLLAFHRIASLEPRTTTTFHGEWDPLFAAAGIDPRSLAAVTLPAAPALPHDERWAWTTQSSGAGVHIIAATLKGAPVYFAVDGGSEITDATSRNPLSTNRSAAGEAWFWLVVSALFTLAAILARHNLRFASGDRRRALRVAIFVAAGLLGSALLQAHHVPRLLDEVTLAIGVIGWALVWGTFTWLVYLSLEPHVARIWPATLASWTRLLTGRWRDPVVGRDVLLGLVAGIVRMVVIVIQRRFGEAPPEAMLAVPLNSLRSVRHFASEAFVHQAADVVAYALGTLFLLFLVRMIVRKTFFAVIAVALLGVLIGFRGAGVPSASELAWALVGPLLGLAILLRLGLLPYVVTLFVIGLFTRGPVVTLDLEAWNIATSLVTLSIIVALAAYGFVVALGGRPALTPLVRRTAYFEQRADTKQ